MAFETRKAMDRRWREHDSGGFQWRDVLKGKGIDVGCGPNPVPGCVAFDTPQGDANHLSRYFEPDEFDFLHGSQVLEHMRNPVDALKDWLTLVRPYGYIVQTVPCWELYEGMVWPSRYNPDHRSTWSMWQKGSPAPIHCKLPEWLDQFGCEVVMCRLVDDNYDYSVGTSTDQTWNVEDGVECWLEFVLRK